MLVLALWFYTFVCYIWNMNKIYGHKVRVCVSHLSPFFNIQNLACLLMVSLWLDGPSFWIINMHRWLANVSCQVRIYSSDVKKLGSVEQAVFAVLILFPLGLTLWVLKVTVCCDGTSNPFISKDQEPFSWLPTLHSFDSSLLFLTDMFKLLSIWQASVETEASLYECAWWDGDWATVYCTNVPAGLLLYGAEAPETMCFLTLVYQLVCKSNKLEMRWYRADIFNQIF